MNIEERKRIDKKIKQYEKFGILEFQKFVFKVEKVKFKLLKKICPNFIEHYDKYCDRFKKKAIKKAETEEEIKRIKEYCKMKKMEMRKEFYQEQNRNYHIDKNNPTEIKEYLEWNKQIHKNGIIKNSILIPIFVALIILGFPLIGVPLVIIEAISTFINIECINIQNYNLCRYEILGEYLQKRSEREVERKIQKYGQAADVIYDCIEKNENLPTIDQILDRVETKEQLIQIKEMLLEEKRARGLNDNNDKVKGVLR